jgi:hypothetical protein
MAKAFEKPPPPADQAFSGPTAPMAAKSVPPTAVTYGEAAGKSWSGESRWRERAVGEREGR